ncbi:hypothetical protein COCNU_09G004150 [Cocos nucifera]|uniref:CCR4-NOT transcription complex subunit 1 HEAT repeat domain-containing protein n=1 Tax=Cocos nucifera TaxID=13894 RepID=A0A8K0IJG0_COCNU|nr:hypothetical protein COCNU_09G004150 [Cocos nucifera]
MSMADVTTGLGYGCTIDTSHCKEMLSLFQPLNDVTLSKLLGTIACTHTGLKMPRTHIQHSVLLLVAAHHWCSRMEEDCDNIFTFFSFTSFRMHAPKTNWTHVMENLEHEGFNVPDEKSFCLLVSVYTKACETAYNLHQYEVSFTIFPVILKDSTKIGAIHHLWCVNPNLVLRGFVNTHIDPNNLLRILDICQELKILSPVLDATPFPFSIKLAAIASWKEHINLEKWLNGNLSTYKDAFYSSVQQQHAAIMNVYQEMCSTFFKILWTITVSLNVNMQFLQVHSRQLASHQLLEEIKRLHVSSNPKIQSAVTDAATSDGSSEAIEAEANTYCHQMFSGRLSIDAMVQMLSRFKELSDRRWVTEYENVWLSRSFYFNF